MPTAPRLDVLLDELLSAGYRQLSVNLSEVRLFAAAGLIDVQVDAIDVPTVFTDFDDLWRPFLGGQGPAPGYCASLSDDRRRALRNQLHAMLPEQPDGIIPLQARAWAARGFVPVR